jgi:predicted transposase/invertase (TIGR01784 family)
MKTLFSRSRSERELKQLLRESAAEGKPLSIMDDVVFKAMLSADNDDSREALRSLLSACTRRPISKVQVTHNDLVPAHMDAKSARLDVNVTFDDGEAANLEMQMKKSEDNLKDRAAFYTAMLQARQPSRGRHYYEVKRVYQIFFLNCELFPDSDKLPRRYSYREESEHDRLTEATEIIFYEMPKLERKVGAYLVGMAAGHEAQESLSEEEKWCIYMKYRGNERTQPLIEELCRKEEGIMRAERAVQGISRDYLKAIREMNIIKNEMDRNQAIYDAKKKIKLEVAQKMKNAGRPLSEIAEFTDLPLDTIEQL